MPLVKCGIPLVDDNLRKAYKRKKDADEIERRTNDLFKRAALLAEPPTVLQKEIVEQAKGRFSTVMQAARMNNTSPGSTNSIAFFLAQSFALTRAKFGLADDFSPEGGVRYLLNAVKRRGQGEVHEMLQMMAFIDDMKKADVALESIARQHKVPRDVWHRIKLDAYEMGMHPYLQRELSLTGPAGRKFLAERQRKFYELLERNNISRQSADQIGAVMSGVADRFNTTYEIARAFGVKLTAEWEETINYLPRMFSPETVRRIGWYKQDNDIKIVNIDGSVVTESIPNLITKSRTSNVFITEDYVLLDAVLTGAVKDIYERLGVKDIYDVVSDTGTLTRAFTDFVDDQAPELIDALVDSRIISKLPMFSTDLVDYMKARYKLPFKQLDETLPYNFSDIALAYRSQLERVVGRSMISHYTAKSAIEGGWGITEAQRLADPETFSKFVNIRTLFTEDEIAKFGLSRMARTNVYVHPVVAAMYKSQVQVLSDPNQMGIIGRALYELNTIFSSQALISTGFVWRQIYTPIFQVWAGGGRLDTYFTDLARTLTKVAQLSATRQGIDKFPEMLDDTKKIYKFGNELITERELWSQSRRRSVTQEIIPWMGSSIDPKSYKPTKNALRSVRDNVRYLADIVRNYPDLGVNGTVGRLSEVINQMGNGTRRIGDQAFHWVGASNVMVDNVGRFSLLKALTDTTDTNIVMRGLNGNFNGVMDFEQAVLKVEEFFFNYGDLGTVDKAMRFVRPFYMFMSRNMFSTFRLAVRRPSAFVNYHRLWAAINPPEERSDVPAGAEKDWLSTSSPMYWVIRDDEGRPTQMFALPRSQFDPIAEGTSAITTPLDQYLYYMGVWPAAKYPSVSLKQRIGDYGWGETSTNRALAELVNSSYGHWKIAFGVVTGEDPQFGYDLFGDKAQDTSYLGVPMSAFSRYLLENMLPITRSLNRSNPGGIFGRPYQIDENGSIIDWGKPAWLTGANRSRRDRSGDFREWWQRTASAFGFNIYSIDVLEEMGWKYEDIRFALNEGRSDIRRRERRVLQGNLTPEQIAYEIQELEELRVIYTALQLELMELEFWAQDRGMSVPAAIRYHRNEDIRTNTLRNLPPEEAEKIIRSFYGVSLEEYWDARD